MMWQGEGWEVVCAALAERAVEQLQLRETVWVTGGYRAKGDREAGQEGPAGAVNRQHAFNPPAHKQQRACTAMEAWVTYQQGAAHQ
jgi:hypothetical protein